jgi:hemoglobin-like flavoprotein
MTHEQITLVRRSWAIFRKIDPQLVGGVFYDKLFTDQPGLKNLFSISMSLQAQKLVDMLSILILHLDDMEFVSEEMQGLIVRHEKLGVRPEHYAPVGQALLWTLQQGLGNEWTEEMNNAWRSCYDVLADQMTGATT